MIQCESYAHRYAKDVLASWFREKWILNREKGYPNSYSIFEWSPDPSDGDHGIRLEYPIISRKLKNGETEILGVSPVWDTYPATLSPDCTIEAVLDVAVCSKDKLVYGLEIVHKHTCTERKIRFLKNIGLKVYEINATWILDQVRRPANLLMSEVS